MSDPIERAVMTYTKSGGWPDTVHLVFIDHIYGPGLEYVIALCGRRGTGQVPSPSSPLCKRCQARKEAE